MIPELVLEIEGLVVGMLMIVAVVVVVVVVVVVAAAVMSKTDS